MPLPFPDALTSVSPGSRPARPALLSSATIARQNPYDGSDQGGSLTAGQLREIWPASARIAQMLGRDHVRCPSRRSAWLADLALALEAGGVTQEHTRAAPGSRTHPLAQIPLAGSRPWLDKRLSDLQRK